MKLNNSTIIIHDYYVVSDEKEIQTILSRIGVLAYNQQKTEEMRENP